METLNLTAKDGYTIVQLNRGKVNAINFSMVNEIREVFAQLEQDESTHGVILTGTPGFFSAGLDVIELYGYDEEKIKSFLIAFGKMHIELSRFSKPFICAITGYSPAGGTVIAITSDYRVMIDDPKFSIGLNEMKVNVQISRNLIEAYTYWLGSSLANRFVLEGKLLNPQEALEHKLVDELCPAEEVLSKAELKMKEYLKADPDIFRYTKQQLRKGWLDSQDLDGSASLEQTLRIWWKPEIRLRMKALIESFSNKKV